MRSAAALVALAAAISLVAQWLVSAGLMSGQGQSAVIWRMLGYFTVLGNAATMGLMAQAAITGRMGARPAAAITVVMAVVGLGYHALLADIWAPQGLAWWADQGLHTAVPVMMVLWWLEFAPRADWWDATRSHGWSGRLDMRPMPWAVVFSGGSTPTHSWMWQSWVWRNRR